MPPRSSIFFLVAFILMCLEPSEADSEITVIICLTLFGFLLLWIIYASWEGRREDMEHRTLAYYPPKVHQTDVRSHVSDPTADTINSS